MIGALLLVIAIAGFRNIGAFCANLSMIRVIHIAGKDNASVRDMLSGAIPSKAQMVDGIALAERAIALGSSNPQIYSTLGLIYGLNGSYAEAITALEKSVELAPNAMWAHFWLGFMYCYTGKADIAVEEWKRAGASPYFVSLGQYYSQRGNRDRAIQAFQIAVAIDPRSVNGHYFLGREYLYQEYWEEAMHEFYLASALAPEFSRAYYFWAVALYQGEKNVEGAIDLAKKAIAVDPLDMLPYLFLGDIAREMRNHSEAARWYQRARAIAPTKAEPLLGLGHIRRDQGDMVGATDYYERAILIDTQNSDAYAFLADGYRRQGRFAEAIEVLKKAISINQVSWYHLLLARVYRDSGMKDKAVEEYRLFMAMDHMGNRVQSELDDLLR
jgi:tetratricopeptide (TPR) repeat protein